MKKGVCAYCRGIVAAGALVVLLGLVESLPAEAAAGGAAGRRLAVVAEGANLAPLVSLLEVELSKAEGVSLVERAELDRVLREQELSAAGLVDRQSLVKVGALLRADAFLLLSAEQLDAQTATKQKLLRVRLAETVCGVRLLDWFEPWDAGKEEAVARTVAQTAKAGLAKLALPPSDVVPVAIVDVHLSVVGPENQWLCRATTSGLSALLIRQPRMVVLEREDLEALGAEKARTAGAEKEFWRAASLIEGTIGRGEGQALKLDLYLRGATGQLDPVVSLLLDPARAQEAVAQGAEKIIARLTDQPPAGTWDLKAEAKKFSEQGDLLARHSRPEAALPMLETAWALDPEETAYGQALLDHVFGAWWRAHNWAHGPAQLYDELEMAETAGRLTHSFDERLKKGGMTPQEAMKVRYILTNYLQSAAATATPRIAQLNEVTRRVFGEALARLPGGPGGTVEDRLQSMVRQAKDANQCLVDLKATLDRLILPRSQGGQAQSDQERWQACAEAIEWIAFMNTGRVGAQMRGSGLLYPGLMGYVAELTKSADPFVSCYANLALMPLRSKSAPKIPALQGFDLDACWPKAQRLMENELKGREDIGFEALWQLRERYLRHLSVVFSTQPDEAEDMLERQILPLIDSANVQALSGWPLGVFWLTRPLEPGDGEWSMIGVAGRYYAMMRRAHGVLATHQGEAGVDRVLDEIDRQLWIIRDDYRDLMLTDMRCLRPSATDVSADTRSLAEQRRALLRQAFPDMEKELQAPVPRLKVLVSADDWPADWYADKRAPDFRCLCLSQDGMLWIALMRPGRSSILGLAAIDVQKGQPVALWQTRPPDYGGLEPLVGLALGEEYTFVAVSNCGLVRFPGTKDRGMGVAQNPTVFTQKDGLPNNRLTAVTPEGDKLWMAYSVPNGESGLGIFDPNTKTWKAVVASTLKSDSPFSKNNCQIHAIVPRRDDVLALVGEGLGDLTGLWKIARDGRSASQLAYCGGLHRMDAVGDKILLKGSDLLCLLEPATGKVQLLLANRQTSVNPATGESSGKPVRRENVTAGPSRGLIRETSPVGSERDWFFVTDWLPPEATVFRMPDGGLADVRVYEFNGLDPATAAMHDGKLWMRCGKSVIMAWDPEQPLSQAQVYPNALFEDGRVTSFVSTPYGLVAIGEGSVGIVQLNAGPAAPAEKAAGGAGK
jgi:hypothetical protein